MRKIDKDLTLATAYKKWLEDLNKDGKDHPEYSSAHKFYNDVVANLLWVQQGLCAYTEMFLADYTHLDPSEWKKGRYKEFQFMGHLDHYDAALKKKKGWEWTNFFVVHGDVNVKIKGQKSVQGVLKPDESHYNPFYYLEYDFRTHHFLPNSDREITLQRKILSDINTLGLNFQPVIDYRKLDLIPLIDDVRLGKIALAEAKARLKQFYTAFEMSIQSLKLDEEKA